MLKFYQVSLDEGIGRKVYSLSFFFFVKNFTLHKRGKGNRDIVSIPSSRIIEELKILLSTIFKRDDD